MSIQNLDDAEDSARQDVAEVFRFLAEREEGTKDVELAERFAALHAVGVPPSSNTGGTYYDTPPFFSPCENQGEILVKNKTKIDWLAFTTVADLCHVKLLLGVVWEGLVFTQNVRGFNGYPESWAITSNGQPYGIFCCGASHGRNYVSLDGTACKVLTDELVEILHDALRIDELEIKLSRIDLCLDFYRGELTWDHARRAYDLGMFKRPKANKQPEMSERKSQKGGRNLGRTLYVGRRDAHVFCRIYEKGLEVFAKLPEDLAVLSEERQEQVDEQSGLLDEDGNGTFQQDSWVRLEVEYKRQGKDLELPLSMMLMRDQFFAGANPYYEKALQRSDIAGVRPARIKSDVQAELAVALANMKRSYGSHVQTFFDIGLTPAEIFAEVANGKQNARLVKAGILNAAADAVRAVRLLEPDSDIPF